MDLKERHRQEMIRLAIAMLALVFLLLVPGWLLLGPLSPVSNLWVLAAGMLVMTAGIGIVLFLYLSPRPKPVWNLPAPIPPGTAGPNPSWMRVPRVDDDLEPKRGEN